MLATRVACPSCRTPLRMDRPVPVGTQVKCPRCGVPFAVAPDAPAAANGIRPGAAPLSGGPPPAPASEPAAPRGNAGLLIAVLGFGAILLLGGGAIAAAYFFLRSDPPATAGANDENEEPDFFDGPTDLPKPKPLIVLTPEEEKKVAEATRKGIEFLRRVQQPDGGWAGSHPVGYTAIAGLTLLECGVKADDPAVQKAAAFLRNRTPALGGTYEISLAVLFFSRLGDRQDNEIVERLALRLVAGQSAAGGWTYGCAVLSPADHTQLLAALKEMGDQPPDQYVARKPAALAKLSPQMRAIGLWQNVDKRRHDFFRGGGDNSNTQFALLALWTAKTRKLPVDQALARVARRFQLTQNADGSWNYAGNHNASGLPTMTCAGLLGLAVGYGLSKETGRRGVNAVEDPAIQKALAHLSKRVGQPRKDPKAPPPGPTEMYFLWSVERVAVLYQLRTILDKEWYHWGLDVLSTHQRPDGHWHTGMGHGSSQLIDTCFALLFLQRVNLAKDLTDKLRLLAAGGRPRPDAHGGNKH